MVMNYGEALDRAIDLGIEGSKRDYEGKPEREETLRGSVDGFKACRGKDPKQLKALLLKVGSVVNMCVQKDDPELKYWQWKRVQVEWMCSVMSAVLEAQGLPVILHPTPRAVLFADKLLKGEA